MKKSIKNISTQIKKVPKPEIEIPLVEMEFADLLEKDFVSVRNGEIVKGKIVTIDHSGAVVDIGYKSEGFVPIGEIQKDSTGATDYKPGDEIEVYVVTKETPTGLVALSKSMVDKYRGTSDLTDAFIKHKSLEGKVTSHIKSGFIIDYKGIAGFLPFSQSGLNSSDDPKGLVNQKVRFYVIDLDIRRKRIIFSRKQALDEERIEKKRDLLDHLKEGDRITGTIKSVTSYGAFVDIGGMDGLLHISDISWKPVKSVENIIKTGQVIELMILRIDREAGRISLGLKQLEPDPWDSVDQRFTVGTIITGHVTALTDFGAFIELEPGIEGMVHISEMSWTHRVEHPSQLVRPGESIQAKVLNIDKANRRISLGIRQTQPDPWDGIENKYQVGNIIKGKVTAINSQGAVVQIEDGIEGFVNKVDFSWIKPVNHPSEFLKEGDPVEARIIKLNSHQRKMGLGIKQLTSDPWLTFFKKHKEGSAVTGKVTKIANSGIFVELEGGLEGFCRITQLDSRRIDKIEQFCKIGDELEFKLVRLQKAQKRIVLSRRALLEEQERAVLKQYTYNVEEAKTNLGELLEEITSSLDRSNQNNS